MIDQLDSMIAAKDFNGILARLRNESSLDEEDSLCYRCLDIVEAVRKEMNNPAGSKHVCLAILQVMTDKGWKWSI